MKIIEKIHNVTTNEITEIEREATELEIREHKNFLDFLAKEEADKAKTAADKATAEAKLAALGLTTDDLKALGLN